MSGATASTSSASRFRLRELALTEVHAAAADLQVEVSGRNLEAACVQLLRVVDATRALVGLRHPEQRVGILRVERQAALERGQRLFGRPASWYAWPKRGQASIGVGDTRTYFSSHAASVAGSPSSRAIVASWSR